MKQTSLKQNNLFFNTKIYTQSDNQCFDSMAVSRNRIVAVGNHLESDSGFSKYNKIDLAGRSVVPGFVDSHTHIFYYALSLGRLSLQSSNSMDDCLKKIEKFAKTLGKNEWVVGEGYSVEKFAKQTEPDRLMLDKVTGGRPAFLFSKDEHTAWVNTRALELAGINAKGKDPVGGSIERFNDGTPSGILREKPAFMSVHDLIPEVNSKRVEQLYKKALAHAYSKGVVGVHSFDDSEQAFAFFVDKAVQGKLGLRVNYYFPASKLPQLREEKIYYGTGTEFFRVAGIKIFADGALGSQTALCFNKYLGSKDKFGIEVMSVDKMKKLVVEARRLGLPSAIHAIGDKAVSNVLDVFENVLKPDFGARHRIEHVQLIRRKDISRLKEVGAVASMQPSHCPSDIKMIRKYWGARKKNAFVLRSMLDRKIPLALGSDVPIEPLDPLAGIEAAVRRALPGSRDVFCPDQKLTILEALHGFTAGAAYAVGQENRRGYLLPDYPADFVILEKDIAKTAPTKIASLKVMATILDGKLVYSDNELSL